MSNVDNVTGSVPLSPYCHRIKGRQKNIDTGEENSEDAGCHPLSPLSSLLNNSSVESIRIDNSSISNTNNREGYVYSNINNRRKWGDTMTDFQPHNIQSYPDSRLKDPKFKAAVRVVLDFLGLESNLGNFRKYDAKYGGVIYDWLLVADRISSPRFPAVVQVIGTSAEFALYLPGRDRDEALENLDTESYEFKKWL